MSCSEGVTTQYTTKVISCSFNKRSIVAWSSNFSPNIISVCFFDDRSQMNKIVWNYEICYSLTLNKPKLKKVYFTIYLFIF